MTDEGRYYMTYENVSDDYGSSLKLRQQNLIGSYDMFVPLGDTTRLFGGASAGLTKLENESKGYSRDTDIGYLVGLQAGILQKLGDNTSGGSRLPLPAQQRRYRGLRAWGRQAGLDRRAQQQAGLPGSELSLLMAFR